MWEILRQSLVINPETDDFTGISDLDLLFIDGVWHLYATTRTSPGITVLTLDADTLTPVQTDRQNLTQNVTFPATGSEIIPSGNSYAIISTGRNDVALPAFAITADGEIGSSLPAVTDPFQANLLAIRSFEMSGGDYLLASAFSDGAVRLYRNSPDSGLILQDTASLSADPHTLAIAHVGGTPFALAVAENGNLIDTFSISESGAFTLVSDGGLEAQVGISGISKIETIQMGNKTFALVAAFGSSSLTVFEVTATGDLVPTDHVIDGLNTRFARTSELTVVQDNDRVLVLLAGNDDGFTILELLPQGRLILRAVISDATDTTLDNVSGLTFFAQGDTLHIYAASEAEAGITHFTVGIGVSGLTLTGTDLPDSLEAGADNDVLHGADGDDVLIGGAGDDVLSDGAGRDDLSGGVGRDVFLLEQDGVLDRILDFEPGVDSLDLSLFDFLFSVQDLVVETTAFGATVFFSSEVTEIHRYGGGGLSLEDLGEESLLPLSHGFLPGLVEQPPPSGNSSIETSFKIVATRGPMSGSGGRDGVGFDPQRPLKAFLEVQTGDDTILGSDGNDTLNGGLGDDTIDGGLGNDLLIGGEGRDTFVFSSGRDRIDDFESNWDTVQLAASFWSEDFSTAQQVLDRYGIFSGSTLVLDFEQGDRLIINGDILPSSIADQIIF